MSTYDIGDLLLFATRDPNDLRLRDVIQTHRVDVSDDEDEELVSACVILDHDGNYLVYRTDADFTADKIERIFRRRFDDDDAYRF